MPSDQSYTGCSQIATAAETSAYGVGVLFIQLFALIILALVVFDDVRFLFSAFSSLVVAIKVSHDLELLLKKVTY